MKSNNSFEMILIVYTLFLCILFVDAFHSVRSTYPDLAAMQYHLNAVVDAQSMRDSMNEFGSQERYKDTKFVVFGGGAFSLAMAKVLSYKNISTSLLVRSQDVADHINLHRVHPKYLSDLMLPTQVWATSDIDLALEGITHIIHAVPMQQSRKFLEGIKHKLPVGVPVLSVTKGVEQGTFGLMSDVIPQTLGKQCRVAYLSGPSFAREIMNGQATAVVVASTDDDLANEIAAMLSSVKFRCHTTSDVTGVELGGAMKNVIALAAGMCEGLGLGMNALSSLITRGCIEMGRMGVLLGADQETFGGLAGVGDTFGTCLGPLSRNRQVGVRLAKGEKLDDILKTMDGVSEGVLTSIALEQLIKTKVKPGICEMKFPIISGVASIIRGNITPEFGLRLLMQYPLRDENPY